MAKTFITTGTGAQQTLGATQNEKIPVYDSKADAEADLTNLSVGQLVATESTHEDDVADLKTYIRNQNILSDYEEIQWTNTTAGAYEAQFDGFVCFGESLQYQTKALISYDGGTTFVDPNIIVQGGGVHGTYQAAGGCLPLKKGWKFYCQSSAGGVPPTTAHATFYKLRDYTGR